MTAIQRAWVRVARVALAAAVVLAAFGCAGGEPPALPEVRLEQLPPQVASTLELIKRGGPFPYRRDGAVFGNRERRLPAREQGYYREYTVPTPGAKDRGARRIVAGRGSEYYYTDDHYDSFRRIRD
jgi:ribonuclease T1